MVIFPKGGFSLLVIGKPLLTPRQIQEKVQELAQRVNETYEGTQHLVAVAILRGAFMFFADLLRHIKVPLVVDFIAVSSYVKTDTTGEVRVHCDLREDIRGKDVLLVEDIVDTGITLNYLRERLLQREPRSLRICALLDKKERRVVDVPLDFVGFQVPNVYLVGYGLDYDNQFRNLPYIAEFKKAT
jgi:hypoxanthine phosphoribosyltransferase